MKEFVIEDTPENRMLMAQDKRIKATRASGKLIVEMPEDNDDDLPGGLPITEIND